MKRIFHYSIIMMLGVSLLILCSDDKPVDQDSLDNSEQLSTPKIQTVTPVVSLPGNKMTILGENFGNNPSNVKVTFDGIVAQITSFTKNKIEVIIPPQENKETVEVQVKVGEKGSNTHQFRYDYSTPKIDYLFPESGKAGTKIEIIGSYFSNVKDEVVVTFNGKPLAVESFSDSLITIIVPEFVNEKTVNVQVKVKQKLSNSVSFNYDFPVISSISSTCFYGSLVVIKGVDFSANKNENIVRFDNVQAEVIEANKNTLRVITPSLGDALKSVITVTKAGEISNGMEISVNLDQNKIATYNWSTQTVKPGVIYKTGQFTLFGSSIRRINILDITLDETNKLGIGFSTNNATTVNMIKSYNGVGGINAGYFPMSGSVDKDPYIRIDRVEVQKGYLGNISQRFVNSALIIHNNVASVRHIIGSGNLNLIAVKIPFSEAENLIVSGPILFIDNNHITPDDNPHNTSSTARTGLGVTADGKRVIMVTVDSGNGSTGVTIPQLGLILQSLGSVDAMSFDGGGSTTMYAQGFGNDGLVNLPSGSAQRAVRSVIYVK